MLLVILVLSFYLGFNILDNLFIYLFLLLLLSGVLIIKRYKYKQYLYLVIGLILGLGIRLFLKIEFSYQNIGLVIQSKENYIIFQTLSGRYYLSLEDNQYEVLDILKINGNLKDINFTTYESNFDFNEYLFYKAVYKEIKNVNIEVLFYTPFRIRSLIQNSLINYSLDSKTILSSLLFSYSNDSSYSSLIYNNGLSYYLKISSFHVYFFFSISDKLLSIKLKEKVVEIIDIFLAFSFMVMSNYSFSIFKIFILFILRIINREFLKNKYNRLELISILYLSLIIFNPTSFYSDNFLFTYPLYLLIFYLDEAKRRFKKRKQKYLYLIVINLYVIGLQIINNHCLTLLQLPFVILLSPIISFLFSLGLLGLIIPLYPIINILSSGIMLIVHYFDIINIKIYTPSINFLIIVLYYLLLLIGIYFVETKRIRFVLKTLLVEVIVISFSAFPYTNYLSSYVSFINVGQGDSTLIVNKNHYYLIDTGGLINKDLAIDSLIPYFKKKGIPRIDCLFITHYDYDHYGAMTSLINNFRVNEIVDTNDFEVKAFTDISFTNLNRYQELFTNANDSSLVLYTSINNYSFLFMGDASKTIESKIIEDYPSLRIDYLKVGHHGSKTSTSEEFISVIKPSIAFISCGKNNKYNHPDKEVLTTLDKYNIQIRRTDLEGTIEFNIPLFKK